MDLSQLKELLRIVADSDIAEVEIEEEGTKIVVRRSAATLTVQPSMPYGMYPFAYAPAGAAPVPQAPVSPPPAAAAPQASAPAAPAAEPAPETKGQTVHAPIVGTFYRAPAPDADPFVKVGDRVAVGDVLCIIEAMKLMNEIESEVAGTIREILVENSEAVEYDQPLFVVEPA